MSKFKELIERFEVIEVLSEQDEYPDELDDLVGIFGGEVSVLIF